MSNFIVYDDATGEIVRTGRVSDPLQIAIQAREGQTAVSVGNAKVDPKRQKVDLSGDTPVIIGKDAISLAAVDANDARIRKDKEITRARRNANASTVFQGKTVAIAPDTIVRLHVAVDQLTRRGGSLRWKLGPRSYMNLNASEAQALLDHVWDHMQDVFAREEALSSQLDTAPDTDAIDRVDPATGWERRSRP